MAAEERNDRFTAIEDRFSGYDLVKFDKVGAQKPRPRYSESGPAASEG